MNSLYACKSKQWYSDTLQITKYNLRLPIASLIELLKDEFGVIWEGSTTRKAPIQEMIQSLEYPEKSGLESETNKSVSDETIQQAIDAIDAVDASIEKVKAVAKKVTKAEEKLKKQLELGKFPAIVKWDSDFMGIVTINKEVREFWVNDPYSNPIVNLVTSNGTIILSAWDTTKDNPFMIAAIREFHNVINSRSALGDIDDRLLSVSLQLVGSKKRANWYAQSHEELVLLDGKKMEVKKSWLPPERLTDSAEYDFSSGVAYKKSQYYARSFPDKYDYVEGFALTNNRLYHHAWLLETSDGLAVDVTLSDPGQLFGISTDVFWADKVIASRVKDRRVSDCYHNSIIEGNFLDDFNLLQSGVHIGW